MGAIAPANRSVLGGILKNPLHHHPPSPPWGNYWGGGGSKSLRQNKQTRGGQGPGERKTNNNNNNNDNNRDMFLLGLSGRYFTLAALSALLIIGILYASASHIYSRPLLYQPKSQSHSQLPLCRPSNDSSGAYVGDNNIPWKFETARDGDNYGLSRAQCQTAFPKLYIEIEKAVVARRGRNITFDELNSKPLRHSMGRAMVYQGAVCIVNL